MPNYNKKVHILSIMMLAINMDRLCWNHFLVGDLNLLKIYQWLHQWYYELWHRRRYWLYSDGWCWLSCLLTYLFTTVEQRLTNYQMRREKLMERLNSCAHFTMKKIMYVILDYCNKLYKTWIYSKKSTCSQKICTNLMVKVVYQFKNVFQNHSIKWFWKKI